MNALHAAVRLTPLDGFLLLLLLWGAYGGFRNGAIVESCTTGATLVALYGSYYGWQQANRYLVAHLPGQLALFSPYLSCAGLFVGISMGIVIVSRLLRTLARWHGLGLFDRLIGPPLGLIKHALLISAMWWGGEKLQVPWLQHTNADSRLLPYLKPLFPIALTYFRSRFPSEPIPKSAA